MSNLIHNAGNIPSSNLDEYLKSYLISPNLFPHQSSGKFRPSEASAEVITKYGPRTLGACARKTWFRLKGYQTTGGENLPHQIMRMEVGKAVEQNLIEHSKKMGLYCGSNIPFQAKLDGAEIAGELDLVLRTTPCAGSKYILECKSIYGNFATKDIFGSFLFPNAGKGKPKDSHLMQLAIYLRHFSRFPVDHPSYIPFGALFVCDRGDGHFGTFDVWLEKETSSLAEGEQISSHKIKYYSKYLQVPITVAPFTVEDILSRYRHINAALEKEEPPKRDFKKEYSEEEIEQRYESGEVSESRYKTWKSSHGPRGKGKVTLGDWNCGNLYCPYSSLCWEVFDQ